MNEFDSLINAIRDLPLRLVASQLLQFLLWTVGILAIVWLTRNAINKTIDDNNTRYRAKKAVRLIGYLLIIILAITTFTGKVQYFSIAIGLFSAGLAFALQEVILSVAGWVSIFSTGTYKPGDRIEMNGIKGDVIDIAITRTTLMEIGEWTKSDNYSGRIVQISNAFVFKSAVHNYSTDFPFVWDNIMIPIKYGSDLQMAREAIREVSHEILDNYSAYAREHWKKMVIKYLIEDANVDPLLTLQLTDNWVEFNLRFVVDYKKRIATKDRLFESIKKAIDETNGQVELASETFELLSAPPLNVNLGDPGKKN